MKNTKAVSKSLLKLSVVLQAVASFIPALILIGFALFYFTYLDTAMNQPNDGSILVPILLLGLVVPIGSLLFGTVMLSVSVFTLVMGIGSIISLHLSDQKLKGIFFTYVSSSTIYSFLLAIASFCCETCIILFDFYSYILNDPDSIFFHLIVVCILESVVSILAGSLCLYIWIQISKNQPKKVSKKRTIHGTAN